MSDKPSFYEERPESEEKDGPSSGTYTGPERRRQHRRENNDRRQDVRFEIEKEDRRKGEGRRKEDHTPKYW